MRPNGTFRQADISRILKAAKQAGVALEIELENGNVKIRPLPDKAGANEQAPEADNVVL
jgi:hypothetical protein